MGRTNADIDRFLHLLRTSRSWKRGLSTALRQLGVARSTFYYWRKQLAKVTSSPTGVVRKLQRENRLLAKRVAQLEENLAVAREALGKPWRRWPSGGPPSAGQ